MPLSRVIASYTRRAAEYIDAVGSMDHTHLQDRELVLDMATRAGGLVLDAGCGPGQWTNFLHAHGIEVVGVDMVPTFIRSARQHFPGVSFKEGMLEDLPVPDGSVAGILSWYSIIHTEPQDVESILREFARCIKNDGYLLLGFFTGLYVEAYEHQITPAYQWPVDALVEMLEVAGFAVIDTHTRNDPQHRPHGAIFAQRASVGT